MMQTMKIFSEELVDKAVQNLHIADLSRATIGEVLLVAQYLENETGIPFIRMDQGSPGLPVNKYGVEAEKAALDRGVGSQYPAAAGVPDLKKEASRFVKAFLDVDVSARSCVPTVGSVAGSFGSFIACTQRIPGKDKVLFIDPGFPIQKSQLRVIGAQWKEFDIYSYRGEALRAKLESILSEGDIAAIVYSNPNNPAWICLEEEELAIIGELATKYDNTKTTIDGGIVTSGTVQLAGSTGAIKAGITGNGTADTDIRIWAGNTYGNRGSAPFRVTQGGFLYANNANIKGIITAKTVTEKA